MYSSVARFPVCWWEGLHCDDGWQEACCLGPGVHLCLGSVEVFLGDPGGLPVSSIGHGSTQTLASRPNVIHGYVAREKFVCRQMWWVREHLSHSIGLLLHWE